MIEVSNIEVWGWKHAIRGMRNPLNSWNKSDSECKIAENGEEQFIVGHDDIDLMNRLYNASLSGDNHAHRKFMRQIFVSMDITAPRYWWTEADTYKIRTTFNSCSTVYTIASKEFTIDDFSYDHLPEEFDPIEDIKPSETKFIKVLDCRDEIELTSESDMMILIDILNFYREKYLQTKDKEYWWQLIRLLPQSYNQTRTLTMNYEVAATMIKQRERHKLDEWNKFVEVLKQLPLMEEITYPRDC